MNTALLATQYGAVVLFSIFTVTARPKWLGFAFRVISMIIVIAIIFELFKNGYTAWALFGAAAAIYIREGVTFIAAAIYYGERQEPLPDYLNVFWLMMMLGSGAIGACTMVAILIEFLIRLATT